MSSSHQFVIMFLHAGQKNCHEVCVNYLSHCTISLIDSGKGSFSELPSIHVLDNDVHYCAVYPGSDPLYFTWCLTL